MYFGTPKSKKNLGFKLNNNKAKIILEVFDSLEKAVEHEVYLHELWDVSKNPHFANASKQTSKKFSCTEPWNKGKSLHYPVWNKGKKGLQSHSKEWKQEASARSRGDKNYFYEGKKFVWLNVDTLQTFEGTVLEAFSKIKECKSKQSLYELTWCKNPSKKLKTHKGWSVISCIIYQDNQQPDEQDSRTCT